MSGASGKYYLVILFLLSYSFGAFSQPDDILKYVNPYIGTTITKRPSMWGNNGGTYPGAVAPWGFIQITPETRTNDPRGYDYRDSSIYFFSCINHSSGFPTGSSGNIFIMPVKSGSGFQFGKYSRHFLHINEKAEAGFYHVVFDDEPATVDVTSSTHTGMMRITLPHDAQPEIFIGDIGEIKISSKRIISGSLFNALIISDKDIIKKEKVEGGYILTFASDRRHENVLLLKISASLTSPDGTLSNLKKEVPDWDFNAYRKSNQSVWNHLLSQIEVEDSSDTNKAIFYTALYHSFLVPYVISDVDCNYKGYDGLIHKTSGKNQYGLFSPWDTFRSLHPLLCLMNKDIQHDMILSALDIYRQSGHLPKDGMAGNHIIPVIVDSYFKGIDDIDTALAYRAMKDLLAEREPSGTFSAYRKYGFVPASFSESVTKTVEYAYDDWALSQFAGKVIDDRKNYLFYLNNSFSYRNLFDKESLFIVPKTADTIYSDPGYFGYKEGDKWSYSCFVPHDPMDMINLSGGNDIFSSRLDSALKNGLIFFDNEPVLHIPYLFNYAQKPFETQKWVKNIMITCYLDEPWGLPGNDDLGSMSSWFVFSAMGFYPVCPGRPLYDLGSPLFKKVVLHFPDGRNFVIRSDNTKGNNPYVKSVTLNGSVYNNSWISHSTITRGGEIVFRMDNKPSLTRAADEESIPPSETKSASEIVASEFSFSKKTIEPDQEIAVRFTLTNRGSPGVKVVRLYVDGREAASKNVFVGQSSVVKDSIVCKLYKSGKIRIEDLPEQQVEVNKPSIEPANKFIVTGIGGNPVFRVTDTAGFFYGIKNISGSRDSTLIKSYIDSVFYCSDRVSLDPGESVVVVLKIHVSKAGIHTLKVGNCTRLFKTYAVNTGSKILDISLSDFGSGKTVNDCSGFKNNGEIVGEIRSDPGFHNILRIDEKCFVRFKNSASLDSPGKTITIMAWIYPSGNTARREDLISKGDFILIQESGGRSVSFFAGGWGHGECAVTLPENWRNRWHHVAGVKDSESLTVYIDGREAGRIPVPDNVSLYSTGKWILGRNEEFPGERIFNGYIDHFKIFTEPLSSSDVLSEMNAAKPENSK